MLIRRESWIAAASFVAFEASFWLLRDLLSTPVAMLFAIFFFAVFIEYVFRGIEQEEQE